MRHSDKRENDSKWKKRGFSLGKIILRQPLENLVRSLVDIFPLIFMRNDGENNGQGNTNAEPAQGGAEGNPKERNDKASWANVGGADKDDNK